MRTSQLRYYWEQRDPRWSENLAVVDCTPRKDLSARLTVAFSPPDDFSPRKVPEPSSAAVAAGIDPRRPGVGLIFGLAHPDCCEATGYAVLLLPDAVRLVRFTQNPPELKANEIYAKKVLEEKKVDLGGQGPLRVSIKVTGAAIDVDAGGKAVRLRAPEDRNGYAGLYFGGHGFASVSDVSIAGP